MNETKPKWSRRKDARPAEIVDAAMDVFVEHGFAGTKLTEVAKRAGVAKGTLYLYFETKEDLFRATARQALSANLQAVEQASAAFDGSVAELVPVLLKRAAGRLGDGRIPGIVRMVLAESRAFPDLARIWHDEVVARMLGLLTGLIAAAQAKGEIRAGDPKLYAMSIVAPMIMGLLFHEVFGSESDQAPDLDALAAQHSQAILNGIFMD
ncbi:TetR/AcrR family transcriptional regulator [Rhizobium sp. DKSPLA3]|uniref:TetR/AcrR family transcriptional regulator n=1 Tax=Rhizobium quercicola TaxID=2901226 RepID=A0A9X1NXQ7_9HYPH|nr:TetR/AcrR family transcriptional regulator [Rhizobium quercicola]MCD7111809.1 TetR/AcrR family transcriptional regulator [Rhizobium quercicola]